MSRDDVRNPDTRESGSRDPAPHTPDVRELHPTYDWGAALKRDARHLINEAEYEFRKIVGAPRTLDREPEPERQDATAQKSRSTDPDQPEPNPNGSRDER